MRAREAAQCPSFSAFLHLEKSLPVGACDPRCFPEPSDMSLVCRSHEIRTPLSGVLGMISLLNETQLVSHSTRGLVLRLTLQL